MGVTAITTPPRGRVTLEEARHNVRTAYLFTFFFWAARSILFQQVIAGFVFVLTGSNQPVGVVKGVQGISQLVFSLPAGYMADRSRRDRVLRLAAILGVATSMLTLWAVMSTSYLLLNVSFALWGLFAALQSPAMEALFAESIPHGQRSYPLMIKYNISNLAMVLGPLLSVLLFLYVGDEWHIAEMQPVLAVGAIVAAIASVVLFAFDDDRTLEDDGDEIAVDEEGPITVSLQSQDRSHRSSRHSDVEPLRTPTVVGNDLVIEYDYSDGEQSPDESHERSALLRGTAESLAVRATDSAEEKRPAIDSAEEARFLFLRAHHVPVLIFLSDFIMSNGAGMTIYFFPLFFKEEYGLSPIQVSLLFLVQPLVVMVLSVVAQRWSKWLGRMPIIVWTRVFATACLLFMSVAKPLHLQIALFLMRGGMMRCSQPLRRSVLMDYVRKEVRARWNALEGVSVFSFSGSAVLGGYLVDMYDYRTCFYITAWVYFAGLALELFLLPLTKHAVEK